MSSSNLLARSKFNEDETLDTSLMTPISQTSGREKDLKDNNYNATANHETNGRSAALEKAYVWDVYENCEDPVGSIRPRVAQFLSNLDPGSLVCDVGCGNGRYLTSACNQAYSIGIDRCFRLAKVARSGDSEVAICDNLELPFRDDSFDAVLSLAVVHHFATTERRINAIRELARILRIGGRVVITVWAMEQKSRRFESQDVLIPWQSPKTKNAMTSDDEDDDEFLPPYHAYTYNEDSTHSNSSRSQGDGDSSSLSSSSPSDTCYSFVRRALQKLAGGKKSPWFLDSWNSKDTKNDSSLDYEDAKDLPIELRRLEDFDDIPEPLSSAGLKSRSLGSILNTPPPKQQIVRSRSSVPSLSLGAHIPEMKQIQINESLNQSSITSSVLSVQSSPNATNRRPKLIKQKQSISDDTELHFDEKYPYNNIMHNDMRAQLLRKQSSLNEELMAESRIREKERIRKKIQKQMSLNETFLCRSIFTKRLQVIREGLTSKLKTSTGSLERVTKCGIVKIIQNIKSASNTGHCSNQSSENNLANRRNETKPTKNGPIIRKLSSSNSYEKSASTQNSDEAVRIRRHSRESGSDSSKDSSLQSDTSIESEDSFASVIYIPKKPETQTKMPSVPTQPTSPLIMPCPTPIHSPAPVIPQRQISEEKETNRFTFDDAKTETIEQSKTNFKMDSDLNTKASTALKLNAQTKISTIITPPSPAPGAIVKNHFPSKFIPKITRQTVKDLPPIPKFKRLSSFPIVRRITSSNSKILVPKMMSLEIFNPETDDLDSDSSEPSSPDSIDSVINALQPQSSNSPTEPLLLNNERVSTTKPIAHTTISNSSNKLVVAAAAVASHLEDTVELVIHEQTSAVTKSFENIDFSHNENEMIINKNDINLNVKLTSQQQHQYLTSNYNNSLKLISSDESSDNVDNCKEYLVDFAEKLSAQLLKELDSETCSDSNVFEDEHVIFDQDHTKDPYLKKINGDIRSLNLLRDELRERRLMLANLSTKPQVSHNTDQIFNSHPPSTIQELEEDDSPPLSAKIQSHLSQNSNLINCLGTSQATKKQQKFSDLILEENEDDISKADEDSSSRSRSRISFSNLAYNTTNNNFNLSNDTTLLLQDDSFDEIENSGTTGLQQMKQNLLKNIKYTSKNSDSNNNSSDSWANSNSTSASLDSPSVGVPTHHRYYHVFREGELDALINKHVSNLHIVSSYYERASWCVVCEKVQVWTI